jgi:gem associated protein 6
MMEDKTLPSKHPVFSANTAQYMNYLYKEISVTTEDGATHIGRCFTVDPVSQTIVLVKFCFDDDVDITPASLTLVMGHCVRNITIVDEEVSKYKQILDKLLKSNSNGDDLLSKVDICAKKEQLISWLNKNLIPVTVSKWDPDILNISDAVFIRPPYNEDNCQSTNEIILGKIQGLISNMPKDINNW